MKRTATAVLAGLPFVLSLAFPAGPCFANSKGHGKKQKGEAYEVEYKEKETKHGRKVQYKYKGGPPPWAPAHGYRGKQGDSHEGERHGDGHHGDDHGTVVVVAPGPAVVQPPAVYVAPFGIDVGRCNREAVGSVLGGALGGLAGSAVGGGHGKTAAIIGGTVIGILVGGSVGRAMDQIDQACVGQVLEHATDGRTVQWKDPDSGVTYNTAPTGTYQDGEGRYCREYQTSAVIGGKTQKVYGTACRQPDGSWEIVK